MTQFHTDEDFYDFMDSLYPTQPEFDVQDYYDQKYRESPRDYYEKRVADDLRDTIEEIGWVFKPGLMNKDQAE